MEEKFIEFEYKARYSQLGTLEPKTKNLIFVIHGYGQLSKYFIRKFNSLDNGDNCIIAPEGLSRFYLEGFSGRVGATWMTKEDRETDIANYVNYLNALYVSIKNNISPNTKISIIGFSQGSATVSRWVSTNIIPFDQLVLWAGIFPPDMNFTTTSQILQGKKITYVYGENDPFITKDRLDEMKQLSTRLDVTPEIITFSGDHNINEDVLRQIFIDNS